MPTDLGISIKNDGVNVEDLHPELRARTVLAQKDLRLQDNLSTRVSSGARTYAQQKSLYAKYLNGTGNLAANPDRISGGLYGSRHMVQPEQQYVHGNLPNNDGWAYAIDIGFWKGSPSLSEQKLLREVLDDYGLTAPLIKQGEWWHFVPDKNSTLVSIAGYGSTGQVVKDLQIFLKVDSDGIYGTKTRAAVESFQKINKLSITGDWTISEEAIRKEPVVVNDLPSKFSLGKLISAILPACFIV